MFGGFLKQFFSRVNTSKFKMRSVYYMSILLLVIYPTEIDKYVKNEYIQGYFLEKIGKHPKAHQQRPSLISFMPNFSISLIVPFPCLLKIVKCFTLDSFFFFWLCCVFFIAAQGLSLVAVRGFLLFSRAFRLSNCGKQAYLPHGMWDLTSLTRGGTCIPCSERWILNHWTTRQVPLNIGFSDACSLFSSLYPSSGIIMYCILIVLWPFIYLWLQIRIPNPDPFSQPQALIQRFIWYLHQDCSYSQHSQKWTLYSTLFLTPMSFCYTTFCLSTLSHYPPGYTN